MFGLIIAIVLIYQVYKAANENGRSGIGWAAIAFFGSIIFQLGVGIVFGVILLLMGQASLIDTLNIPFSLVIGIINLVLLWQLAKWLSRVPETETFSPPPPPPTFGS